MRSHSAKILLGSGGGCPGIDALDIKACHTHRVLDLPKSHSVYSISSDPRGERFAFGTRTGRISIFAAESGWNNGSLGQVEQLDAGSGVLDLSMPHAKRLFTSDAEGAVNSWALDDGPQKKAAFQSSGAPYAALQPAGSSMVGLTTDGHLTVWDQEDLKEYFTVEAVSPPSKAAIVNFLPLDDQYKLAYPGSDGSLVTFIPDEGGYTTRRCHRGDWYAACRYEDKLLTLGKDDATLKCWDSRNLRLIDEYPAPAGVVSATRVPSLNCELLLVNECGEAGVYIFTDSELVLKHPIAGKAFRSVCGPSHATCEAMHSTFRKARIREVAESLQQPNAHSDKTTVVNLHRELCQLDAENISLGILADEAEQRRKNSPEAVIEELRYRHKQASMLGDKPASIPSLLRFAHTLETVYAFEKAKRIYSRISRIDSDALEPQQNSGFNDDLDAIATGNAIIGLEPRMELATVAEANTAISECLRGDFQIATFPSVPLQDCRLSAEDLLAKYREVTGDDTGSGKANRVRWIRATDRQWLRSVVIPGEFEELKASLQFVAIINNQAKEVALCLTLGVSAPIRDAMPAQSNRAITSAFKDIRTSESVRTWWRRVHRDLAVSIARLMNTHKASMPLRGETQ